MEIGYIETITGQEEGVIFTLLSRIKKLKAMVEELCTKLSESNRILPGGYIYLSDLLSTPSILNNIGRIIAKTFRKPKIDAVMTVATKGVPLANAVANVLNVPFVIVRRDLKITEGSTVEASIMCRVQVGTVLKDVLVETQPKSWKPCLIVDDFLKGGGQSTA